MDFELTEDQVTVRELASEVFDRHADPTRLVEVEAGDERCDRATVAGPGRPPACSGWWCRRATTAPGSGSPSSRRR